MELERIGRRLCFILRHKPEALGLTLDPMGFGSVDKIIEGFAKQSDIITLEEIIDCVEADKKNRFQYLDGTRQIRCVQGHSFPVSNSSYNWVTPPDKLYHGTSEGFLDSILKDGLQPQTRQLVHLTDDLETAKEVGNRYRKHGPLVLLEINTAQMVKDDIDFYVALNGVYLTKWVDPKYLTRI